MVEDVRIERTKLRHWLQELNCEVIEAFNGVDGLDLYHAHRPELVITDLVMPEKDGVTLLMELKEEYPDVKIFAISGAGLKEVGEYLPLAQRIGALRTFPKPIDKEELKAAVMDFFPETNPGGLP